MQAAGIGISVHFIPHFHFTYWKNRGLCAEDFPNAEKAYQRTITIPLYPDMSVEQVARVAETVKQIGSVHHK
jgi:dTDP-4-amino-4,6-dideoxygalactose transaminase